MTAACRLSHSFIDAEIVQLRAMAMVLPPVFFGIAAFLVNMVLGRIVALERAEIGLLKAIGYRDAEVALHYLMFAALVGAIGIGIGWLAGGLMARGMAGLYAQFYNFPWLIRSADYNSYAVSGLFGLAAAGVGAIRAALDAARLAPALAMAPPAPPHYRRGLADRLFAGLGLSQPMLMVLRGMARWPLRSGLTSLGLALGVAVLVAANFMQDALAVVVDSAFFQSNRQQATLVLTDAAPLSAVEAAARLPGVMAVEPEYAVPVLFRHGTAEKRTALTARPAGGDLARTVDADGRPVPLPAQGLLMSRQLAGQLHLRPGDLVETTFLSGRRETMSAAPCRGGRTSISASAPMSMPGHWPRCCGRRRR